LGSVKFEFSKIRRKKTISAVLIWVWNGMGIFLKRFIASDDSGPAIVLIPNQPENNEISPKTIMLSILFEILMIFI
jgi:hypothetical protein